MDLLEAVLWLTLNVYHEARSEDSLAQQAVVYVTLNRSRESGASIKEVVLAPYQFSWTHQLHSYVPQDTKHFYICFENVLRALANDDFTGGATHYYRASMRKAPYWATKLSYIDQYGAHKFFK